jgi:hypothetical protein
MRDGDRTLHLSFCLFSTKNNGSIPDSSLDGRYLRMVGPTDHDQINGSRKMLSMGRWLIPPSHAASLGCVLLGALALICCFGVEAVAFDLKGASQHCVCVCDFEAIASRN